MAALQDIVVSTLFVIFVSQTGGTNLQQDEVKLRPQAHQTYNERLSFFAHNVRLAHLHDAHGDTRLPARVSRYRDRPADVLVISPKEVLEAAALSLKDLQERGAGVVGDEVENGTVSALCLNHSSAIVAALTSRQPWALQLLDAIGKPRPAISEVNLMWPGAYHQCLQVRGTTASDPSPMFAGQYCTAFVIDPDAVSVGFGLFTSGVQIGLCVPDSCSEADVKIAIREVLKTLNATTLKAGPVSMAYRETAVDTRAAVAAVICGVFAIAIILGTVLDIFLVQMPEWGPENKKSDIALHGHGLGSGVSEKSPLLNKSSDTAVVRTTVGQWSKALLPFSVWTNGQKLLSTSQPEGSLTCIHGVRFLSMTWVVLGHTIATAPRFGANVITYMQELIKRWTFQAISSATVSVDSFFVLSGLLVTFLTLKEMKKNNGKLNWFMFFFHRFWRLTPVYMLCLMIYACFMRYWGEGPFWPRTVADRDNCEQYWWTNLLYINNLGHFNGGCFGHAWYLANDMQFYILSPLIFVPLYFFPVVGVMITVVFLLVTSITPALLVRKYGFSPGSFVPIEDFNATSSGDYIDDYYVKPYNRMGPYIVGMLAGYFLFRTDCKLKLSKYANLCIWAAVTACALAVIYGLYDHSNGKPMTLAVSAFYIAVHRQVWGACLAWVIVACVTGNGGFVNTLLSWSALVPLSRLTYCVYLIHLMVLDLYTFNQHDLFYMSDINVVALFLAVLVISYMAAFVVSLAFEAPMMGLEKILTSALSSKARRH